MLVIWDGDHILKAYYDPKTQVLDLLASTMVESGRAAALDGALSLGVDEDGVFHHMSLAIDPDDLRSDLPARPVDCPVASQAEVEIVEGSAASVGLDATAGVMCLAFKDIQPTEWARLGPNLIWLGLDEEGRLGALVVEGVSTDPGGKAQAAWLSEMGYSE